MKIVGMIIGGYALATTLFWAYIGVSEYVYWMDSEGWKIPPMEAVKDLISNSTIVWKRAFGNK